MLPLGPPGHPRYDSNALLITHQSTTLICQCKVHTVSSLTYSMTVRGRCVSWLLFILYQQSWSWEGRPGLKVHKQALAFMNEYSQHMLFLTRGEVAIRTLCPAFPPQWFITVVHHSPFIVRRATLCIPVAVADSRNKSVTSNKNVWKHRLQTHVLCADKVRN